MRRLYRRVCAWCLNAYRRTCERYLAAKLKAYLAWEFVVSLITGK